MNIITFNFHNHPLTYIVPRSVFLKMWAPKLREFRLFAESHVNKWQSFCNQIISGPKVWDYFIRSSGEKELSLQSCRGIFLYSSPPKCSGKALGLDSAHHESCICSLWLFDLRQDWASLGSNPSSIIQRM